jgi:hypothetical protein
MGRTRSSGRYSQRGEGSLNYACRIQNLVLPKLVSHTRFHMEHGPFYFNESARLKRAINPYKT